MNQFKITAVAAAFALVGGAAGAGTVFLESVGGNDPFNTGITVDGVFSASLAKCDTGFGGDCDNAWQEGSSDGTYTVAGGAAANAFTVTYSGANAFEWSFTPANVEGELKYPLFIAVKTGAGGPGGSQSYELFGVTGDHVSGSIDYADFAGASGFPGTFGAISHVSFYNGAPPNPIPLPAAGWLLIAGVGGMAALRRRGKA